MLWWIADILFIFVVLPVVVVILIQVLQPIREIRAYADDIADHGGLFGPHLESTSQLAETQALVKQVNGGLIAYVAALDRIG